MKQKKYIINSLLDLDFYKLTMGQLVFYLYSRVPVKYAFKNRTKKVSIPKFVKKSDLKRELDHVFGLNFTDEEIHYLRGLKIAGVHVFRELFLQFLEHLILSPYDLKKVGGEYQLEFSGPWALAIYWETLALSIINELYYRALMKKMTEKEKLELFERGREKLATKIEILLRHSWIAITDFGTRRRFARWWQEEVVATLASRLPKTQFLGTSNVYLAMKYNLTPIGTLAHEMFMVMSGLMHDDDDFIRASHNQVLKDWANFYQPVLLTALTDTYGTKFFFKDMTAEQAKLWKALRQDSGDPITFGENAIKFYEGHGIDPKEKLLVFSDGLDINAILKIAHHFKDRINVTFGWGTNLTNDLGLDALSLVVKAIESCGYGTVKFSDNLAKATGKQEDIEKFKQIFGYTENNYEECVY